MELGACELETESSPGLGSQREKGRTSLSHGGWLSLAWQSQAWEHREASKEKIKLLFCSQMPSPWLPMEDLDEIVHGS